MAIHPQVPNAITVARIPLAIVFFVLLLVPGTHGDGQIGLRWAAAGLFILAISTDWVDGYLARRYELVSDFGKLWDPIADKMLTGLAFVGLAILDEAQWWMVIVILIREWGITAHRLMVRGTHDVAAAWMGKAKTAAQGVVLAWALLPLHLLVGVDVWELGTLIGMWAVVVLTIASGVDYVIAQMRGSRSNRVGG